MVSCLFCCKCSQHLFEGRFTAPFKFKIVFLHSELEKSSIFCQEGHELVKNALQVKYLKYIKATLQPSELKMLIFFFI